HAEQNKILQEYTKLNDDFTHKLKEEHRWTDEKETGEKRPKPASPKNEIVIARQKQEQKDRTKKKREEVMGEKIGIIVYWAWGRWDSSILWR
ncbi:hypothetical protein RhiirB3_456388, partial [Rhizophagus irregularis]